MPFFPRCERSRARRLAWRMHTRTRHLQVHHQSTAMAKRPYGLATCLLYLPRACHKWNKPTAIYILQYSMFMHTSVRSRMETTQRGSRGKRIGLGCPLIPCSVSARPEQFRTARERTKKRTVTYSSPPRKFLALYDRPKTTTRTNEPFNGRRPEGTWNGQAGTRTTRISMACPRERRDMTIQSSGGRRRAWRSARTRTCVGGSRP
jgi:hypothetical protein